MLECRVIWPAAILLLAVVSAVALALPERGLVVYYYDEHDRIVGARGWDCRLEHVEWGQATLRSRPIHICSESGPH